MNGLDRVLVRGGSPPIGSNVTDELVLAAAAEIVVLDNFDCFVTHVAAVPA